MTAQTRPWETRSRALRAGGLGLCLFLAAIPPALAQTTSEIAPSVGIPSLVEPASLAPRVAKGDLPPVAERLPASPRVLPVTNSCPKDKAGGTLTTIGGSAKDTRLLAIYGYARLVGYDESYRIVPDILERFEVEDGRIFTLHLRKGMRWSDGEPFTSEDFRYFWEDMALNGEIAKFGPPAELLVDGEKPEVGFPDPYTVRYAWAKPNPGFLPALAAAVPVDIFRPAHYLRKYHARYAEAAKLEERVKKAGQRNWAALHFKKDRAQRNDNIDLPTLEPWMLATEPPSERLVFKRNPFFHRVDAEGRQLPYVDEVALAVSNSDLIPAKVASGDSDLQAAYLSFSNYPFLKQGGKRQGYEVRRWTSGKGSHVTLYPNLNVTDPVWRDLVRKADFRRALSLAINRDDINRAIFYGLASPGANTVLPGSPFYDPALAASYAQYDPVLAGRLLDALGLTARNAEGLRLLPDGREMRIVVETAGEVPEQTDVLELVRDDWRKVGIGLLIRESQREVFRNRIKAGSTLMSVWTGLDNGLPTPMTDPEELAPSSAEQLQWPSFGMFEETAGTAGENAEEIADLPDLKRLLALRDEWRLARDDETRSRVWREMLAMNASDVFSIGIVSQVDQIVVVSDRLRNVPERGVYNFDPGAFFGIYKPDTFHFACDRPAKVAGSTP